MTIFHSILSTIINYNPNGHTTTATDRQQHNEYPASTAQVQLRLYNNQMSPYERCSRANQQSKVETECHDGPRCLSMLRCNLPACVMSDRDILWNIEIRIIMKSCHTQVCLTSKSLTRAFLCHNNIYYIKCKKIHSLGLLIIINKYYSDWDIHQKITTHFGPNIMAKETRYPLVRPSMVLKTTG